MDRRTGRKNYHGPDKAARRKAQRAEKKAQTKRASEQDFRDKINAAEEEAAVHRELAKVAAADAVAVRAELKRQEDVMAEAELRYNQSASFDAY